jgi:hypothetical protein
VEILGQSAALVCLLGIPAHRVGTILGSEKIPSIGGYQKPIGGMKNLLLLLLAAY